MAGAGIATVRLQPYYERLYYIGSDRSLQESSWTPDTQSWSTPGPIGTTAKPHLASPIGVTMVGDEIWLFWFTDDKQLQYATSTYTASTWSAGEFCLCPSFQHSRVCRGRSFVTNLAFPITRGRVSVQNISAGAIPGQLPRSLSVAHSRTSNITQIFYLDGVEMRQVYYSNDQWSVSDSAASCPKSRVDNGPLGVVGYGAGAGAKLYYLIDQGNGDSDDNSTIREVETDDDLDTGWRISTLVNQDYG